MKIIMSHPTGNSNVRAMLGAFDKAVMLAEFNTTIAIDAHSRWLRWFSKGLRQQLTRRSYPVRKSLLKTHPFTELARTLLPGMGLQRFTNAEHAWASIDAVYRNLDRAVAKRLNSINQREQISAVYAYEDGALETFKKAKKLGITCIYDLPIAYWETARKLLMEEADRLPDWAVTLGGGITDSVQKLERKTQELELADVVLTPGSFVAGSLPAWAADKRVIISPFGSPERYNNTRTEKLDGKGRKLRVLFAGSMSQRKGLGDLFQAIKLLNSAHLELVVMGSAIAPMSFYKNQLSSFTYLPNRPHEQVLELMASCDVFCLPSIVEGRALVMQEAMSQGLPLIITPNTGGEDLIKPDETGFLVPIRSAEDIATKLQWFLDNRNSIKDMGELAREHAAQYTWNAYSARIVHALQQWAN